MCLKVIHITPPEQFSLNVIDIFSLGDARGEEPGDLMPASTADNLSQGDLHHEQGGQGGEQEPQGSVEKS